MTSIYGLFLNMTLTTVHAPFNTWDKQKCPNPHLESFRPCLKHANLHLPGPYKGRAKIEGATVTLSKVTLKDAGEYRCEVSASSDSVKLGETNVTLNVLGRRLQQCLSDVLSLLLG